MFKYFFGSSITIPTLRLSGVIGQTGMLRSGLTIQGINKLIDLRKKLRSLIESSPE